MSDLTIELKGKELENYIANRKAKKQEEAIRKESQKNILGIIQRVTEYDFINDLMSDNYSNWSYEEARALYNYYNDLAEDLNENIEFDRVAIRCDWSSYKNYNEALEAYGLDSIYELQENTTIIDLKDSILMIDF